MYNNITFNVAHVPWDECKNYVRVSVRGSLPMRVPLLMEKLGRKCSRVTRVSIGPYSIRDMVSGTLRAVSVPQIYLEHVNPLWRPFIQRDWPYFRSRRLRRLRALSKVKALSSEELNELNEYSMEELSYIIQSHASDSHAESIFTDTNEKVTNTENGEAPGSMAEGAENVQNNCAPSTGTMAERDSAYFTETAVGDYPTRTLEDTLLSDPARMADYIRRRPATHNDALPTPQKIVTF